MPLDVHCNIEANEPSPQADAALLSRRKFFKRTALAGTGLTLLTEEGFGQMRQGTASPPKRNFIMTPRFATYKVGIPTMIGREFASILTFRHASWFMI